MHNVAVIRHTLNILQYYLLQDFQSVLDRFRTLCIKDLRNDGGSYSDAQNYTHITALKLTVFGVILVRIFPHSN